VSHVLAAVLATGVAAWVVLVMPWRGNARYARFVGDLATGVTDRERFYLRSIITKWGITAVLAVSLMLSGWAGESVGLRAVDSWEPLLWLIGIILVGGALVGWRLRTDRRRARLRRAARTFLHLIPGRGEKGIFIAFALTAGITEELLFRSFGFAYVLWMAPHWSLDRVAIVTSIAFGLVHRYQGIKGIAATALVGWVLAQLYIETGSILAPVVVHSVLDLRLLQLSRLQDEPVLADRLAWATEG
jgi:membrane protease YdiL (CAAX protease family)